MKNIDVKIKRLRDQAVIPYYATEGSAGMDLTAAIPEPVTLAPNEIGKIPTGIAIGIENPHIGAFVYPRSGLSSKFGISLINSVGVIDSDYTGEIICPIVNHSETEYVIQPGDRIAQLVFHPVYKVAFHEADSLEKTDRGAGGFGSSGLGSTR